METIFGLDYPTLWFLVIGGVFTGYAILDGFDLGAGALHLFFRKEKSRRIALNAIGPVWDGNEVWIVIGGGALFAGFPVIYANMFSAFYIPFMLFLVVLIFRAIGIEVRSKEESKTWRRFWDVAYSLSSILIALLLGIVVGNVIRGIPLDGDHLYRGSWLAFLNPYALMVGITTVALFMMHGAIYLTMKTQDKLYDKLTVLVKNSTIFFVMTLVIVTIYTLLYLPHMTDRLSAHPTMFIIPLIMMLAVANITRQISKRKYLFAFLSSSVVIATLLVIVAMELYPTVIYAPNDVANSLTVYNSASSEKSLGIMLTFAAIGVPLVASYTVFVFYTFRGKVKLDESSY